MSLNLAAQEERIQSLADMLSLVAILGGMEKSAIQRVLVSLGSALLDVRTPMSVDRDLASRLLVHIAKESGEQAAIDMASDMHFVAMAWKTVMEDALLQPSDPYRALPYGEIIFALINRSGDTLNEYGVFEQFGGAELVLPMHQLAAALRNYAVPHPALLWNLVGFQDPQDQALVAQDEGAYYLFKFAPAPTILRVSEIERGSEQHARQEHEIRVDPPLFAAFIAGLLGDMLYWAARLRSHVVPGHGVWARINTLLMPTLPLPPAAHTSDGGTSTAQQISESPFSSVPPVSPEPPVSSAPPASPAPPDDTSDPDLMP